MQRLALVLLGFALLMVAPVARAEDPPPEAPTPSPEEQFTARLDALPTPEAAGAFTFEGDILMGGRPSGEISMRATPTILEGGEPGWEVEEAVVMAEGKMKRTVKAVLDRRLQPLHGTLEKTTPGQAPSAVAWARTEGGFRVGAMGQDLTETPIQSHEGDTLTATVSLFLFCRLALPEPGAFQTQLFSPGRGRFEPATWKIVGEEEVDGQAAWVVRGQKEGVKLVAAYGKKSRELLGVHFQRPSGATMTFRPKRTEEKEEVEEATDPMFEVPASSARGAAMTAALAFATGDVDLLEKIVHWPSVHTAMKAASDEKNAGKEGAEPFPGVDALKGSILERLRKTLVKRPREMIEMGVKMVGDQLITEEIAGGLTRVKFPAMFQSLVLDVQQIDGKWLLARLPDK